MFFIPRIARKDLNTPFLHTMVQGVNKEYIFYKEDYIEKYLDIIAFGMMNNHGHFLVYTENMNDFGKFMQKTNLQYVQMYNRNENRCGGYLEIDIKQSLFMIGNI